MEMNILDYVTEWVLLMEYDEGQYRPVIYFSKSLNKTERNYEIHYKEMLAVIIGLENQRHIYQKVQNLSLRSGPIIKIWNIL